MGFFIIIAGAASLGVFICVLDAVETSLSRRVAARRIAIDRERLEAEMAELWPARLQQRVYNQDEDAA